MVNLNRRYYLPVSRLLATVLVIFISLISAQHVFAQGVPQSQEKNQAALSADPLIGAGDLLDIRFFDVSDLSGSYRVSGDGVLELPLIGKVPCIGLTSGQLAAKLADLYRNGGYILGPQITVRVLESTSEGFTIEGAVKSSGAYPMHGPMTLAQAVALAGGLDSTADTRIEINRRTTHEVVAAEFPMNGSRTTASEDLPVYAGDVVFVPKAAVIYVLGQVARPGGIVMRNNGRLTMLQALSEAQGITHVASLKNAFIMRKQAGTYTRIDIDLKPYINGKHGDMELEAEDVLVVPTNATKLFLQDAGNLLASIGAASIYAIVAQR
jgi:polysaccharide export outer membrane protein